MQISVTIKLVKRQFNIHTDKLREIVNSRSFYSGIIVANIKKMDSPDSDVTVSRWIQNPIFFRTWPSSFIPLSKYLSMSSLKSSIIFFVLWWPANYKIEILNIDFYSTPQKFKKRIKQKFGKPKENIREIFIWKKNSKNVFKAKWTGSYCSIAMKAGKPGVATSQGIRLATIKFWFQIYSLILYYFILFCVCKRLIVARISVLCFFPTRKKY